MANLNSYPSLLGDGPEDPERIFDSPFDELDSLCNLPERHRDGATNYRIELLLGIVFSSEDAVFRHRGALTPAAARVLNGLNSIQTKRALGSQIKQTHLLRRKIATREATIARLRRDLRFITKQSSSPTPPSSSSGPVRRSKAEVPPQGPTTSSSSSRTPIDLTG
jgi:hypothetical protein